jgi:hypothetical protein
MFPKNTPIRIEPSSVIKVANAICPSVAGPISPPKHSKRIEYRVNT